MSELFFVIEDGAIVYPNGVFWLTLFMLTWAVLSTAFGWATAGKGEALEESICVALLGAASITAVVLLLYLFASTAGILFAVTLAGTALAIAMGYIGRRLGERDHD